MKLPKFEFKKTHYLIAGAVAVLFIGWRIYGTVHPDAVEEKPIPVVRTITVGASSTDNTAVYPGEVRGKYESTLAFQTGGKIVSRQVNLGDRVRAGQVLLEIDPKDVNQSVNAAQAACNAALSNYRLAKDNYERFNVLHAKGAVSAMVRDQYKTQFEAADANLQSARAQLTASQNQLGYTRLVADHDGSVASLSCEVGQVVGAGTPVISLVQDGNREIQIFIPENRIGEIQPGQPATITFWALQDLTVPGRVSEIAPMADSVTRTYKVKVAVEEMPPSAKLGMTAKVMLSTGTSSAFLLPAGAIYQTGDKPGVWVIREHKATLTEVKTDGYEGSNVRISQGLQKGDVVVAGGTNKLTEGQEVRLEGSEAK